MANLIPEEGSRFSDPDDLSSQVREYALLKQTMSNLELRQKELRNKLVEAIELSGDHDTEYSYSLYLDSSIEGVSRIQKQGRVSRSLNEEVAERIIEETGIADEVYEMKRVINEDALMACLYSGKITEEQLDEMFPRSVVWALVTKKN